VRPKSAASNIYNESALTLEKLTILKAWAEVYVVSMKNEITRHIQGQYYDCIFSKKSILYLVAASLAKIVCLFVA
jgi:hypothetical protein